MCDATTLISSKQTDMHSCWIIYTKSDGKERLTVTEAKPIMPQSINSNINDSDDDDNDGNDQSLHEILDPELRPEPPIPNNAQSQEIYEEHRRLAKEYLRVDTKLYYAQDFKEKLLWQMNPAERQEKQELIKKMSEKDELLDLYNNLKQQLEKISSTQQNAATPAQLQQQQQLSQNGIVSAAMAHAGAMVQTDLVADDWVVVAPHDNT